jgi:hypothetical protein
MDQSTVRNIGGDFEAEVQVLQLAIRAWWAGASLM